MRIKFCFSGWVRGADIRFVTRTLDGAMVLVESMDSEALLDGLNDGTFTIHLGAFLYSNQDREIEMGDFEVSE